MRFFFEMLDAVRERVGPDFIIGARFTADEDMEGGTTKADGLEIARRLKASGKIDFLNVVKGHIDTDPGLTDLIPIQGMASAPHLDLAAISAVPAISRPFMPRAFPMWRPPAMPSPPARSTWSA